MAMVINSNIQALNAQRHLNSSLVDQNKAAERLASGMRINSAADDAAGLAIANRMTSQVRGLDQAIRNANDGVSLIQTAEGGLGETTNILQRMRELSIQSANGIYDTGNRDTLNAEVQQLKAEIDRIAETTTFNGLNILDGSLGKVGLQIGEQANQTIDLNIQDVGTDKLGTGSSDVDFLGAPGALDEFEGSGDATDTLAVGDILINGQSIVKTEIDLQNAGETQQDIIDAINDNVKGVTANTFTENTADDIGTGFLAIGETLTITATNLDSTTVVIEIENTIDLQEMVDQINVKSSGVVEASIDDDGKLVVAGEGLASILMADASAGALATGHASASENAKAAIGLSSEDGITIERGTTGTLEDLTWLGFRETNTAGTLEGINVNATAFAQGDMTINGVEIGASVDGTLLEKLAAINLKSDETGVTAKAYTSMTINVDAAGSGSLQAGDNFSLNGIDVVGAATVGGLITSINNVTVSTGLTAREVGDGFIIEGNVVSIQLGDESVAGGGGGVVTDTFNGGTETFVEGDNEAAGTAGTALADGNNVINGGIQLTSDDGKVMSVVSKDSLAAQTTGFLNSNASTAALSSSVDSIDISTVAGANKAIDILSNAIETVSEVRGELGAVSNRLAHTVSNLSNVSENASAAKSQIMDADFAVESGNLSRAQVLQQAGNAMLAQANARPQQVLSLLQ